ncbi:hypothetical protein H6A66_16095 [Bacteroides caecigallinarum]|uniref:hypothetical protein n=1 Tax=Bacteroides caecigallinarum TaxID=1411144 RepID=UPI001957C6E9|nr:hypothetical protein [Bacteroides caecigallinarum]MBM6866664.1 hypothetical protein [Bacteroides caecigallinarum]
MKENKTSTALSVENVDRIFSDCLFRSHAEHDEYVKNQGVVIKVQSVQNPKVIVCFHSERLESHREEIKEMVLQLPESFHKGKGGGHSFLNMCENKDGDLWTGFQTEQEKLALLGMATHVLMPLLPIEESHILPGGMPYFRVEVDE